ncbi:MAG: MATE family efflux transporter, partial [Oscillospiraceae bacterium]
MIKKLKNIFAKLFSISSMTKNVKICGELPTSKEAYNTTFKIALPSAIEAILVSLIGSVDTIMVGGLGPNAIAAVGITNQPKFILLSLIFSLNVGVTAIVARRKGQDDQEGANSCLRQSIIISFAISIIMGFLGFVFARPILLFAGAQSDVIDLATSYFKIIMISIVFSSLSLTINAAQRGIGNTKISMRTNIGANVFNLFFNYLLINGIWFFPTLGTNGAGIATLIGSIVGCIMSIKSLFRTNSFLYMHRHKSWKFDKQTIKALVNVGGSAMVEQVFMRVGFFSASKVVALLGTVSFATHQICMNIINFSFAFGDGLSIASSSLVGQSLGAKRPDMAMIYGKIGQRMAFCISTVLFFMFIFGRKFIMSLFTKDPQIIALGGVILIIIALSTHFQTSQTVISGCLRGAGDTKFVAMTSFISIGIVRPVLTYLLCIPLGIGLTG